MSKTFRNASAFTLVELLTVISIIAILASLSLVALTGAMQSAKEIKTLGTIQKLDAAMLQIFEGYEDRFARINGDAQFFSGGNWYSCNLSTEGLSSADLVKVKLHLIRDLMRMEMPQSWAEVFNSASTNTNTAKVKLGPIPCTINSKQYRVVEPPVLSYYYSAYEKYVDDEPDPATKAKKVAKGPQRASLLYLIIANLNPEALEGFGVGEIGDTDSDGIGEFVDAWGQSIDFLRWAPAFTGSDRQPDLVAKLGINLVTGSSFTNFNSWKGGPNGDDFIPSNVTLAQWSDPSTISDATIRNYVTRFREAIARYPDPFDTAAKGTNTSPRAWFLYPLIYSVGPDGQAGIIGDNTNNLDEPISPGSKSNPTDPDIVVPATKTNSPACGIIDPFAYPFGMPRDNNGTGRLGHYDNIHNHRAPGGF